MVTIEKVNEIEGLLVITPKKFEDERGYFQEVFNNQEGVEYEGLPFNPVQENESLSKSWVVRGLHFQKWPHEQAKLVRCTKGMIIDVAMDIRKDSPTYGKLFSILLTPQNNKQLFIPQGFAHGFINVDLNESVVHYLTDDFYSPSCDSGYHFDDEMIYECIKNSMVLLDEKGEDITFDLIKNNVIRSEKDNKLEKFER